MLVRQGFIGAVTLISSAPMTPSRLILFYMTMRMSGLRRRSFTLGINVPVCLLALQHLPLFFFCFMSCSCPGFHTRVEMICYDYPSEQYYLKLYHHSSTQIGTAGVRHCLDGTDGTGHDQKEYKRVSGGNFRHLLMECSLHLTLAGFPVQAREEQENRATE